MVISDIFSQKSGALFSYKNPLYEWQWIFFVTKWQEIGKWENSGKKKRVDYIVFCFTNDPLTSDFITWVVKI